MDQLAEQVLKKYLVPGRLNVASFILMSMRAVEEYSFSLKEPMTGEQKLQAAQEWLPKLIDRSLEQGLLSEEDAGKLKSAVEAIGNGVESLMTGYIAMTKNPKFLQLRDQVTACCWPKPKAK